MVYATRDDSEFRHASVDLHGLRASATSPRERTPAATWTCPGLMTDFTGYKEFVFCGYGEPTCALENLIASARYVKEKTGLPIRVNSNGLGNLYYKRDIVPQLAEVVDSISISLNEATAEKYEKVTRPSFPHAYEAMLDFAEECGKLIPHTQLSIVDILPEEDIKACQRIADSRGVHLKVRPWEHSA